MKVTLVDGGTIGTNPIGGCTGYRAEKIEMEPGDFRMLANFVRNDPQQAYAILLQLENRFVKSIPKLSHEIS